MGLLLMAGDAGAEDMVSVAAAAFDCYWEKLETLVDQGAADVAAAAEVAETEEAAAVVAAAAAAEVAVLQTVAAITVPAAADGELPVAVVAPHAFAVMPELAATAAQPEFVLDGFELLHPCLILRKVAVAAAVAAAAAAADAAVDVVDVVFAPVHAVTFSDAVSVDPVFVVFGLTFVTAFVFVMTEVCPLWIYVVPHHYPRRGDPGHSHSLFGLVDS